METAILIVGTILILIGWLALTAHLAMKLVQRRREADRLTSDAGWEAENRRLSDTDYHEMGH